MTAERLRRLRPEGAAGPTSSPSGQFAWDDTWRYGFDINRASSSEYLRDFRVAGYADTLTSQAYIEGFGQGSYTRLDARAYQGLTTSYITAKLPYVAPRYEYSFVGQPDALGGRVSVDAGAFNVIRDIGTSTQRANLSVDWERPVAGALGDLYKLVLHVDGVGYNAKDFTLQPNYGVQQNVQSAQGMPTAVMNFRWPFMRDAGDWGTQTIEPIAQLLGAPNGSSYQLATNRIPNEDSLDIDFTDANLFAINRFPGVDRLEGGTRANLALHGNWRFPSGGVIDGLVGEGFRTKADRAFAIGSGLEGTRTDIVSHISYQPYKYFDVTARQRFDRHNLNVTFADAVASAGPDYLRVSAGYLYSKVTPFTFYDVAPTTNTLPGPPRNEVTLNAATHYGAWRLNGFARRDIEMSKMVGIGGGGAYEDECFIFDVKYYRRYTSINNDHGATTILFTITLKTVGQFGFHAS